MDLGEQTLRYYLKVISLLLIFLLLFFSLYFFYILNKKIIFKDKIIEIQKGENIENILKNKTINLKDSDITFINFFFKFNNIYSSKYIHYGEFYINESLSSINLLKIISKPSNILNKLSIIEGWSKNEFNFEIKKHFSKSFDVPFEDIIADTYFYQKNEDFELFIEKLKKLKKMHFSKYKNNEILNKFTINEIMIIGSLIEKEGLDINDKKKISSVIFNRLNQGMKLQIDATVLFSITDGRYNLNRKLLLSDLKFKHPYNTYLNKGLPPKPISYVGKKTIDLIFENNKTDFLFYFFDKSLNKHVFSKNYEEHKQKLKKYRNEK